MARTSNATFISYRRETGGIPATALFQRLTASGVDVFLDIESIGSGTFDAIILAQIEVRPYFLLVLTPGTLRRCEEANDWLLREIEHALATGATIVPVHSAHFNFNEMEHFLPPQTWISLRRFNALALPSELSSSWTERLCREFLRPLAMNEKRLPPEHAAAAGRMTQEARRLPVITTNALEAQAQFEEGQVLLVAGEFDRALAQYSAAIRLKPDFADAFYDRGLIRSEKGDHHGAIDDYNQAISLVPRMREAFNARGCAHLAAGDKYSALNDFNEAIRLKADYSKAIKHRAIVYEAIGNYDRALADFNEVIRLDPENAEILYRRALVQFRHHDFAKAEHDLTWAIRIDPSFALAFFWRGTVRSSRGDKDGAVADWLRARELDPDSPLQIESYDRRPRRWWRR